MYCAAGRMYDPARQTASMWQEVDEDMSTSCKSIRIIKMITRR